MAIQHLDDRFWKYWKWDFGTQFLLMSNYNRYADRSIDDWMVGKKNGQYSCLVLLIYQTEDAAKESISWFFFFFFLNRGMDM